MEKTHTAPDLANGRTRRYCHWGWPLYLETVPSAQEEKHGESMSYENHTKKTLANFADHEGFHHETKSKLAKD